MKPQRGGWESLQPMLGDDEPDDYSPWKWDELVVAWGLVIVLALIDMGVL